MDSKDTELEDRDGKIIERDIEDEMKTAYIDYAMSVIAVSYTHLTLPTTHIV